MSQSISSVVPISLNLGGGGIANALYATAVTYADQLDLAQNVTFSAGEYRDYSSLTAVAADFSSTSEIYYIAAKWFAAATNKSAFSIYMKNSNAAPIDNVTAFAAKKWRYFQLLKIGDITKDTFPALAAWADAEKRGLPVIMTDAAVIASGADDIGSLVANTAARHVFPNFRSPSTIAASPIEAYSWYGVMATFSKFDPNGSNTAIDTEYQPVSAIGDNLSDTAISILKKKKISYFTTFVSSGEETAAFPVNTWSTSPNVETVDDVYNIDVMCNILQNSVFNYLTTSGRKRGLTPSGFNGVIAACNSVGTQFYKNGVNGPGYVENPDTNESIYLKFGWWVNNDPSEVLNISSSLRHQRSYPSLNITCLLARSGRQVDINFNVE